jgi:hypothetical protein
MKNEKKRMPDYIRFFGGYSCLGHTAAVVVRGSCLLLLRYAKRIQRTGQALRKDKIFLEK